MALTDAQRESIYRLRLKEPNSQSYFKHLAELARNMRESSVNVVETYSGMNRPKSLALMRKIAELGIAKIHGGGAGVDTTLQWVDGVDSREVGRAALAGPLR